jgi:surfactin synthase thioesterase subunit
MATSGDWLIRPRANTGARLRLVCLPYAGGGASAFWPWLDQLDERVELWCALLPGRERRFAEPAAADLESLAGELAREIALWVPPPVALFGHSMGALLAFEVARRRDPVSTRLFVSASKAPHLPFGDAPHLLDDPGLTGWVTRLGGAPAELLGDPELLGLMLPTLRADLAACVHYLGGLRVPVDVPVTAFAGDTDPLAAVGEVAAWREHTTGRFDLVVAPGGHFYLNDDPSPVLDRVLHTASTAAKEGAQ